MYNSVIKTVSSPCLNHVVKACIRVTEGTHGFLCSHNIRPLVCCLFFPFIVVSEKLICGCYT